jgi:hypothetical protein
LSEIEKVPEQPSAMLPGIRDHSLGVPALREDEFRMFAQLANTIAHTEFVPGSLRGSPPKVLAAFLYGKELGLGPMQSLASVNIIDGSPSLDADLMVAMVRQAGHEISRDEERDERGQVVAVTAHGRRKDGAEDSFTFSLLDARRAGLLEKKNWLKYPTVMLIWRAYSQLCRLLFPDVVKGIGYTLDEVEEITAEPPVAAPPVAAEPVAAEPGEEPAEPAVGEVVQEGDEPSLGDYDHLSDVEIMAKLPELGAEDLQFVRTYEAEHEARENVLAAIDALLAEPSESAEDVPLAGEPEPPAVEPEPAPEPWPGYDKDTAAAIAGRLPKLSAEDLEVVREYEAARKNRSGVLKVVEGLLSNPQPQPEPLAEPAQPDGAVVPPDFQVDESDFAPLEPEGPTQREGETRLLALDSWIREQKPDDRELQPWLLERIIGSASKSWGRPIHALDDMSVEELDAIWKAAESRIGPDVLAQALAKSETES